MRICAHGQSLIPYSTWFEGIRLKSGSRGKPVFRLAQQAVALEPVPYEMLVRQGPKQAKPQHLGAT